MWWAARCLSWALFDATLAMWTLSATMQRTSADVEKSRLSLIAAAGLTADEALQMGRSIEAGLRR